MRFSQFYNSGKAPILKTGQTTEYGSGTGYDDGYFEKGISKSYTILTTGQYSGTTNITVNSKTDAHSNNCVVDNRNRLMWSRYVSASVGASSNGTLPWTTSGEEGIFPYVAAANAASLAGYTDWRIPNVNEYLSLINYSSTASGLDTTAFPSYPAGTFAWTSTTYSTTTTNAFRGSITGVTVQAKTDVRYCHLVRGGA